MNVLELYFIIGLCVGLIPSVIILALGDKV